MIKNKRLIALLCTLALMLMSVAPAFAMPDTIKIEQANGQIVQYSMNDAIGSPTLLADMNAKLAAAFEAGKKIIGLTSDAKVVNVAAALSNAGGYADYENKVKAGTIAQGTDVTANVEASIGADGKVAYNPPGQSTVAITAITANETPGQFKFDTDVVTTADALAGKILANGVAVTAITARTIGDAGKVWMATIPAFAYDTDYAITCTAPFTGTGTVKFVAAAAAAAETAVAAYEAATITTYNDVSAATALKTAADAKVALVADAAAKAAFAARVTTKAEALEVIKAAKVKAVNDAANQPALLTALGFFNGADASLIVKLDTKFGGAVVNTSVDLIQAGIYDTNLEAKLLLAITDIDGTNTVDQLKLQAALQYGVDVKVLTGVDFAKNFNAYVTVAAGYAAATAFDTAAEVQTSMIDAAATTTVTNATNAVVAAEAAPNADNIAAAQTLVDALPADVAPATTKADLNARIAALVPVAPVLAAKASGVQSQLLTALQASAFTKVNANLIVEYMAGIAGTDITIAMIQAKVNTANLTAAQTAVTAAEATLLTAAKVTTAQALVTGLADDVAPATTKADLQTKLNVVNALLAVDGAAGSNSAAVLSVLQTNSTVLALTGANAINAPYADAYKTALYAGAQTTRDTAAEVQALIGGVNTAKATAATNAVTDAEATLLTAAKVTTAQALVTALPADVAPATTKADLQTRLNVVNALLAVDGAVVAAGATDASVLAALQANATVLGLTGAHAVNANLAYKAAFAGAQTVRDTAAEVVAIVDGVNSPTAALTVLVDAGDALTADTELAALKNQTLNITGIVDANKAAYFTDKAAIKAAAAVDAAAVQKVVNAVNAIVQLNAATTAADAKTALTTFTLNVTHASSTAFINLSTAAKSEVAGLILTNRPVAPGYADIAAVQTAITTQNTARTNLIAAVNDACDTTKTITAVNTALAGLGYAAFNNLTAARQIEVAEKFLNAYPLTGTPAAPVADYYTTIAAIQSAVDAAIAQ